MDIDTLEIYLYMGNTKKITEWLKSEGCTTRQQVIEKLRPLAKANLMAVARDTSFSSSLHGTCNAVDQILELYPED